MSYDTDVAKAIDKLHEDCLITGYLKGIPLDETTRIVARNVLMMYVSMQATRYGESDPLVAVRLVQRIAELVEAEYQAFKIRRQMCPPSKT